MQSLPNDDPMDPKVTALTPPLPRKNMSQNPHQNEHVPRTRKKSSHEHGQIPNEPVMDSVDGVNVSFGTQDFFVGDFSLGDRTPYNVNSSHATLSVNDSRSSKHAGAFSSQGRSGHSRTISSREFQTSHLEKDINFQYLKHVVMKFMLSREHEVCIN